MAFACKQTFFCFEKESVTLASKVLAAWSLQRRLTEKTVFGGRRD